ncbi:hypothetical protein [Demequina aurantiaca]|uniref:hypothetical protein n=1 Tax=Demequina aurantiaca TaxID=676200 RepID=UPI0007866E9D|nr:hypothetical protein [Demequina aurantiaca]
MIRSALGYLVLAIVGLIAALVGASAYRAIAPFGLVLCILLMLVATVFARTWKEWSGIAVFAGAWAVLTYVLSLEGPGGSLLIATDGYGYGWLFGGSLAIVVVCLIPRRVLFGRNDVA